MLFLSLSLSLFTKQDTQSHIVSPVTVTWKGLLSPEPGFPRLNFRHNYWVKAIGGRSPSRGDRKHEREGSGTNFEFESVPEHWTVRVHHVWRERDSKTRIKVQSWSTFWGSIKKPSWLILKLQLAEVGHEVEKLLPLLTVSWVSLNDRGARERERKGNADANDDVHNEWICIANVCTLSHSFIHSIDSVVPDNNPNTNKRDQNKNRQHSVIKWWTER